MHTQNTEIPDLIKKFFTMQGQPGFNEVYRGVY